jgi:hypothetical protein
MKNGAADTSGRRATLMKVALAVLTIAAAGVLIYNTAGRRDPTSIEFQAGEVLIRCRETGAEWTMVRGDLERHLLMRPGIVDAEVGLPSPENEGKPTGFPVSDRDWRQTVDRINREKELVLDVRGG